MVLENIRRRAKALGIERTAHQNKTELIQAIQHREGKVPCFDRKWCKPNQHRHCPWKHDCKAHVEPIHGLVLSNNIIIGHQLSTLLGSTYGWQVQVIHKDKEAYAHILKGNIDTVVSDIDASALGGLAVMTYCKRHWPAVVSYAITRGDDLYLKKLARDMGGCEGFFYMAKGRIELDMQTGLLADQAH
jgi:hypothetical protein